SNSSGWGSQTLRFSPLAGRPGNAPACRWNAELPCSLTERSFFRTLRGMTSIPVTQARSRLYQLLDEAAESHEPIQITGKRSNAVLISEDDWRSIQETLFLVSIPGMRDSIRKGMAEPLAGTYTHPGW